MSKHTKKHHHIGLLLIICALVGILLAVVGFIGGIMYERMLTERVIEVYESRSEDNMYDLKEE